METTELDSTLYGHQIPGDLEAFIRDTNPWWHGKQMPVIPDFRRWLFEQTLQRLKSGLAPIIVLRGPRQVGKTTLQEQIIDYFVNEEKINTKQILRIQFDEIPSQKRLKDPIITLCRWFESRILGGTFNECARKNTPAYIFFDEVQNLPDWAPQVKALVDHHTVRVLLTGSSSLRIERGRDSLAGRISTLEMGTFLLREIASLNHWGEIPALLPVNGLGHLKKKEFWETLRTQGILNRNVRNKSFSAFSDRGGYPIAQVRTDRPWEEIADQLNETVIKRVIQHDLRLGERGRKRDERLLEEVFRLACRYTGQAAGRSIFTHELKDAMDANISWQRILAYLRFLNDSLLIRLVEPLEIRIKRKKGQPKLCLSDHSLRASWLQEIIPITTEGLKRSPHLSDLAGHLAESIAGYFLSAIPNLDLAWFPKRDSQPEVDFVITIGEHRIPLEIKYRQRIDEYRDTLGLQAFIKKAVYNAPFGILITLSDDVSISNARIVALPLSSLLLMR